MPLTHFRHVFYMVIIFYLNVSKKHLTSNKQLQVFNISTSLNFVPWPYGAETNKAWIMALRFEIYHYTETFAKYFMKYFNIKKYHILCITTRELHVNYVNHYTRITRYRIHCTCNEIKGDRAKGPTQTENKQTLLQTRYNANNRLVCIYRGFHPK